MMNFCTFKNISVFRVFVKSVEPNNNKSVFKLIVCKIMENYTHTQIIKWYKWQVEYENFDF
jgi:hypothetical protein